MEFVGWNSECRFDNLFGNVKELFEVFADSDGRYWAKDPDSKVGTFCPCRSALGGWSKAEDTAITEREADWKRTLESDATREQEQAPTFGVFNNGYRVASFHSNEAAVLYRKNCQNPSLTIAQIP